MKTKIEKPLGVVTHGGPFHADEVFAIALMQCVFGRLKIIRTRNEVRIKDYQQDPRVWVVDVGGDYNTELNNYDHHQVDSTFAELYEHPVASFGLVLHKLKSELADHIHHDLLKTLVIPIDSCDNGKSVRSDSLSASIAAFNPNWDDERADSFDIEFKRAVRMATQIVYTRIASSASMHRASEEIRKRSVVNGILQLDRYIPFIPFVNTINVAKPATILGVIFPGIDSGWSVQGVPVDGIHRERQTLLPVEWRGLSGAKLAQVSGISDAKFVHKSGFLGAFESKESADKAARHLSSKHLRKVLGSAATTTSPEVYKDD